MDGDDGEDKPYGGHSVKGKTSCADRNSGLHVKKKVDIYYTRCVKTAKMRTIKQYIDAHTGDHNVNQMNSLDDADSDLIPSVRFFGFIEKGGIWTPQHRDRSVLAKV